MRKINICGDTHYKPVRTLAELHTTRSPSREVRQTCQQMPMTIQTTLELALEVATKRTRLRAKLTSHETAQTSWEAVWQTLRITERSIQVEKTQEGPRERANRLTGTAKTTRGTRATTKLTPKRRVRGERKISAASCDILLERTNDKADALGELKRDEAAEELAEHISEWSQQRYEENSPGRARGKLDEPGNKTVVPGDHHSFQEHPRAHTSHDVDETNESNQIPGQVAIEASEPSPEALRTFGTAKAMATELDTM
ncbi:hypothetical protein OG21DRAFT_1502035 [Imleria badia]|nr:hypothetical protein OG21DRAFT_1502035 [Imleria badia]